MLPGPAALERPGPLPTRFSCVSPKGCLVAPCLSRQVVCTVCDCPRRSLPVMCLFCFFASFLASVRHPNIVGFLEAFLDDRKMELNIVMEYADGGDLAHVIDKHRKARRNIEEGTIWAILLQLLDGLQALHERRIVHRGGPRNCRYEKLACWIPRPHPRAMCDMALTCWCVTAQRFARVLYDCIWSPECVCVCGLRRSHRCSWLNATVPVAGTVPARSFVVTVHPPVCTILPCGNATVLLQTSKPQTAL